MLIPMPFSELLTKYEVEVSSLSTPIFFEISAASSRFFEVKDFFDLAKIGKWRNALILKSWLDYGESAQTLLNRVVEGERKRRILAVFAARWLEKDEKRDSFWRIPGPDILCTTSDLRGS